MAIINYCSVNCTEEKNNYYNRKTQHNNLIVGSAL